MTLHQNEDFFFFSAKGIMENVNGKIEVIGRVYY